MDETANIDDYSFEDIELSEIDYDDFIDELENWDYLPETMEKYLKIKNEEGDIIPLRLNEAQLKLYDIIKPYFKKGKKIWLLILKARQMGMSTFLQALIFLYSLTHPNTKALTMGHNLRASNNLLDMYERYYELIPPEIQPKKIKSNEKKMEWGNGQENNVATAGVTEVGRSDTLQLLHLTEAAFYPQAKKTFLAVVQGAKKAKGQFIETTANGIQGVFYNMWHDAIAAQNKEKDAYSEYIPVFFSWLEFNDYKKPFTSQEEKEELLSDLGNPIFNEYPEEEQQLLSIHGATLEQLHWRRWAIVNLCQKEVAQFHQEYPTTDKEAFISSGNPVFNMKICKERYNETEKIKPISSGNLVVTYRTHDPKYRETVNNGRTSYYDLIPFIDKVEFEDNPRGYLKVYRKIEINKGDKHRFAAACDVAEGLEQGDFSVIYVMDRERMDVPIEWHGHCDPDILAEEQHKIQIWLKGDIYFGTEINNHGITTVKTAHRLGVRQYFNEKFETGIVKQTDSLGFKTTKTSKKDIINILAEWIREKEVKFFSHEFWGECLTFVRDAKGREAADGKLADPGVKCFDDRVMAAAILTRVHLWLPLYKQIRPKYKYKWEKELAKKLKKDGISDRISFQDA